MNKVIKKIIIIFLLSLIFIQIFTVPFSISQENNKDIEIKDDTGFFEVEQKNDRWMFIDPWGNPFFSTGICGIRASGNYAPELGYSPYHENVIDIYGNESNWAFETYERLQTWEFNTIGYGDKYILSKNMPYCLNLGLAGDNWEMGETPDFFSKEWEQHVEEKCMIKVKNHSEDRYLIGYFLDNEIRWGTDWRSLLDLFDTYMQFPSDSPGKNFLVEFLINKYKDNITSFNTAWKTHLKSFNQILDKKIIGIWPYTKKARDDHINFTGLVAEKFFKTCHEKIRKYDKNHLILGTRFQSVTTPKSVVEASSAYVDVVSINHYPTWPFMLPLLNIVHNILDFTSQKDYFKEYYDLTKKPILISEINFRAYDSGLPNTKPSPFFAPVLLTQKQRAFCFKIFMDGFIEKPYSVGYHWFAHSDQPKTGRFDGENSNVGIVNEKDIPYETLVKTLKEINIRAQQTVEGYF